MSCGTLTELFVKLSAEQIASFQLFKHLKIKKLLLGRKKLLEGQTYYWARINTKRELDLKKKINFDHFGLPD